MTDEFIKDILIGLEEMEKGHVSKYEFEELEMPELMDLVSTRLKEEISSTKKANKKVARTLKLLDH